MIGNFAGAGSLSRKKRFNLTGLVSVRGAAEATRLISISGSQLELLHVGCYNPMENFEK